MVAGRPYYPRYQADFIMGVRGYDLELVGAYSLIIDHLNDRDRPLPDDDRFMAGLLHCSPQRWRKLRGRLIDDGKITISEDGYISNPRFDRDRAKRRGEVEQAQLNGRAGGLKSAAKRRGQGELDLEKTGQTSREVLAEDSQNFGESFESHSRKPEEKSKEINAPPQPPPQAPRAGASRASPESRVKDSTHPNHSDSDSRGRLDDADLVSLTNAVCDAAGYRPVSPAQIDRATTLVQEWRKRGISFDQIIIPTIQAAMATSTEPTRTLGRFKAAVEHEHAKAKAKSKSGRESYRPPASPLTEREDEDPIFREIRHALLMIVGPEQFCLKANRVRFDQVDQGDRRIVMVHGLPHEVEPYRAGPWRNALLKAAKPHGFNEVWVR